MYDDVTLCIMVASCLCPAHRYNISTLYSCHNSYAYIYAYTYIRRKTCSGSIITILIAASSSCVVIRVQVVLTRMCLVQLTTSHQRPGSPNYIIEKHNELSLISDNSKLLTFTSFKEFHQYFIPKQIGGIGAPIKRIIRL